MCRRLEVPKDFPVILPEKKMVKMLVWSGTGGRVWGSNNSVWEQNEKEENEREVIRRSAKRE